MVKTTKEYLARRVKGSMQSYLEGKKDLNWIVGTIKKGGVLGQDLKDIFERLRSYGDLQRFKEVYDYCEKEKWFSGTT